MTLRTSDHQRRQTRALLLARDGPGCHATRCIHPDGRRADPFPAAWSVGHIRPVAHGGSDALPNLRLEHLACNQAAGANYPAPTLIRPPNSPADPVIPNGPRHWWPRRGRPN